MPDERRQFRILYRDFLSRLVDLEVLSAHGDIGKLLAQFAAMLLAVSFLCAPMSFPMFQTTRFTRIQILTAEWGNEEFLIAITIAIVGLFAVISWNAVFPDRRDTLVLGPLPVRERTIFAAKFCATGTGLGVCVLAVNLFSGALFPLGAVPPGGNVFRSIAAYWTAMLAAGLFVYCALLAVQGIAALLLSYPMFLRVSSFLQLLAFFVVLTIFLLTPPLGNVRGLTSPANQHLLTMLPSFWFLGLFQVLNGSLHPAFSGLAARAIHNLAIAAAVAVVTYALAYRRNMRRIVEQPDIVPGDRSRAPGRLLRFAASKLLATQLERAILLFTVRSIARSRQHRLLVAVYIGVGFAIALVYVKSFPSGTSREAWNRLNEPFLASSIVILFFAVVAVRVVFGLPATLTANWVFRITQVHRPASYFAAVKKSLYVLAALPVWIASAIFYLAAWPLRPALEHLAVLIVIGVALVERSLFAFQKIPFACSYFPGKSNMQVRLGAYGCLLLIAADRGVAAENWSLQTLPRYAVFLAILIAVAIRQRLRTAPPAPIQFEDTPPADVFAIDLHRDADLLRDERYLDAI